MIFAIRNSLSGVKYGAQHKIAYLAICPLFPIYDRPKNSDALYAVGFEGAYYPLFKGQRFAFERQGLVRKYTDSKEVMSLELYGPNGSGFSTGLIPIPVLWSPPSSGRMWVTADQLIKDLPEDQQKKMNSILDLSYKNSSNRGTFVNTSSGIMPLLKGDAYVDESGDGTKLLIKGIEKLPDLIDQ